MMAAEDEADREETDAGSEAVERAQRELIQAVRNHRNQILEVYEQPADERLLVLLDFQRKKIHSRPYDEYKAMLREDSQVLLNEEYVKAVAKNKCARSRVGRWRLEGS